VIDLNVALVHQLVDELLHRFHRHELVAVALDDEARGRQAPGS